MYELLRHSRAYQSAGGGGYCPPGKARPWLTFVMLDYDRTIALLDYDGNLVTMDTSNGEVKAVADGVESVIDLSVRFSVHWSVKMTCKCRCYINDNVCVR